VMSTCLVFATILIVATVATALVVSHNVRTRTRGILSPRHAISFTQQKKSTFQGSDSTSLKFQLLQLGAALDRGQSYNPTSGEYYKERMDATKDKIETLVSLAPPSPKSLKDISGEWELVVTTVPNGIFRSSPFFLAIQEAFRLGGEPEKAALFFKLHELQTCSWGISKIGRVAQFIDAENGLLYSEFDTSIFALTTIPILGWFKLLPTFGGCVVTVSEAKLNATTGSIDMEVEYTTGRLFILSMPAHSIFTFFLRFYCLCISLL